MASVTSLGIHKPSALHFLIEEGVLPIEPAEDTYTWQTGADIGCNDGYQDEELLTAKHCVVWSRAGTIHRIFRLDVEGELITKALFANFGSQHRGRDLRADIAGDAHLRHPPAPQKKYSSTPGSKPAEKLDGRTSFDHPPDTRTLYGRALVIVLKTQAHVYFLAGPSHLVHLPFEVDVVFPLPQGILLQRTLRELKDLGAATAIPSAPENTFAFSQSSAVYHADSEGAHQGSASPFAPLLDKLKKNARLNPTTRFSGMLCLMDPLNEVGTVGTKPLRNDRLSYNHRSALDHDLSCLSPNDQLIYASPKDELFQARLAWVSPLTLVVTRNQIRGKITLWTVRYLHHNDQIIEKKQVSESTSKTFSRRQSSYGIETGTTTPRIRGGGLARDNGAIPATQDHALHSDTIDQTPNFLDLAFEDPTEPAKYSRRVSSLLARADLAGNNDNTLFSESQAGHGKRTSRKGTSLGSRNSLMSANIEMNGKFRASKPLSDIRSSMDSVTISDVHSRLDMETELGAVHEIANAQSTLATSFPGNNLSKEIVLQQIFTASSAALPPPDLGGLGKQPPPKVFALTTPDYSLASSPITATVTIFIADRDYHNLMTLRIEAKRVPKFQNRAVANAKGPSKHWKIIRVVESRTSGILDVCSFGEKDHQRVMTLNENSTGGREVWFQTPWSNAQKIELPSPLNLYNPFQISNVSSLRQSREGGFKRVLSGGPQVLTSLQHGNLQGSIDIVAADGLRHRLHIQLLPNNPLVLQVIAICQAILPTSSTRQEVILQAWCNVMPWLRSCGEEDADLEWTAIVVVLFSMATPFIPNRRTDTAKQQKRRKGGLLRSSSGANTDLASWDAMISQEHDWNSSTPAWMVQGPWKWAWDEGSPIITPLSKQSKALASQSSRKADPVAPRASHLLHAMYLSQEFTRCPAGRSTVGDQGCLPTSPAWDPEIRRTALSSILIALHLLREEYKLNVVATEPLHKLTPVLAQIGGWLGWQNWGCSNGSSYTTENTEMDGWLFDSSVITGLNIPSEAFPPPSIFRFIEGKILGLETPPFVSLIDVASPSEAEKKDELFLEISKKKLSSLTPRSVLITSLLDSQSQASIEVRIRRMASSGLTLPTLETFPESVAISLRTTMINCQARPFPGWDSKILKLIGRDDLAMLEREELNLRIQGRSQVQQSNESSRDVHNICHSAFEVEMLGPYDGSAEIDRQSITRLLFKEDQRFAEAAKLVHPLLYPVARCDAEPEWSDTDHLEAQQELVKTIVIRTLSVSLGRGLIFYEARMPMLTEKFPIHGFTLSCVMKPGDTTVTADRTTYSEEKVSWAFFHAGVEAGLSISKRARGVDTSWILFNKPRDLNNRHAGFLLAMGLNGHLRSIAKWVAFKYLTPKHSMTSVGLLLGLAASFLGTMDTLVTRLLSVHVTRMLPPGAAELNLSPLTQTSGIMGIGLLYCNTQHRRMSEIMLSEMENTEEEDSSNPLDTLRDEGYRLAAGFALGYINLGKGKDLKGLHDMRIIERLLALAVAAKRADRIHVLDRATAGATIATTLIFMKSHDKALARKIDIPDTSHQFEYVRPDHFLLRTVAKHLIMWDDIIPAAAWMKKNLPPPLQKYSDLTTVHLLTSEDLPLLNIVAGLCFAVGLRYAGSGLCDVRDLLCHYLDHFMRICRLPTLNYDGKLARITVRNCQDLVALSAACVMAGTGDIPIFRRLRSLHGRTDPETPYGSHLAAHFAIGVLFLSGGTHTFGTSELAVASLLCAFYPLFPTSVLDNKSHLQAFRHFWVLATERRCLVPRDGDTLRPLSIPIIVTPRGGEALTLKAPCLLPPLDTIAKIHTDDSNYWCVTLDLLRNPKHLEAFTRHQSIYLRRRAPYDAKSSIFSATMQALNDSLTSQTLYKQSLYWIFSLPAFRCFGRADQTMLLPSNSGDNIYQGTRGTVLDDRLVLENLSLDDGRSEALWNLRLLFAWAEGWRKRGKQGGKERMWIGREIVEKLRARVVVRRLRR